MIFRATNINEIDIVLDILHHVAIDLKSKNISQWTQWISPQPSDIAWITNTLPRYVYTYYGIDYVKAITE